MDVTVCTGTHIEMAPRCRVCAEDNVEAGHEQSKRHLRNMLFKELETNKKCFANNGNGLMVTTTVRPSAYNSVPIWVDREQSVLQISTKPCEGIVFIFTVRNDSAKEHIFRGIISLANAKFNFIVQNDDVYYGAANVRMRPHSCLDEKIHITFENNIGDYKQPVFFIFTDVATNETIIILKEMEVSVGCVERCSEDEDSPYARESVLADHLVPTTSRKKEDAEFRLEKELKRIFARDLKTKGTDMTEEEKALSNKTKAVFDAGPVEYNYIKFFHNLLWYEEAIIGRNLKNYNMSGVKLEGKSKSGRSYSLLVPGLAEKRPSLLEGDLVYVRPHNQTKVMFEAVITEIQDSCAYFGGLDSGFKKYFKSGSKFDVRFFMSRMPLARMHAAVDAVRQEHVIHKVFPKGNERVPKIATINKKCFYNQLVASNPEQRPVVEHIVSGSSGTAPYLLLGPPGTGKTVTIVEAILQLAKKRNNRILVCTDSNMAADHIATLLVEYADQFPQKQFILRANSEFRVWEPMPQCLAPFSNGTKRSNFNRVDIDKFTSYSVVVTTLIHAAKFARELAEKKRKRVTTHVFIDEAAQASEPASLIPVCGLLARGGALVLAGDPRQLGPVVISREAARSGLGVSMMERLKRDIPLYSDQRQDPNRQNHMAMLKKNFRSHPDILGISNELFYNGELKALAPSYKISEEDILERRASRAIVFYGVQSQEQRMGESPSFYNIAELEVVQKHITALIDEHGVDQSDIGVVTPYIKQVYKMKEWLREQELTGIEVGTVEGFQGKEKLVIIISTVRANCDHFAHDEKFRLGFLVDDKRFNVALTRARAKLLVVGNPRCLQKDPKWRLYMTRCRELGTYLGFDPGQDCEAQQDEAIDQVSQILELTRAIQNMQV